MNHLLLSYSLKAGVALAFLYLLYRLLLARLTFYRVNRYFLLAFSLLCLLAPLLYMSPLFPAKISRYTYYVERTFDSPVQGNIGRAAAESPSAAPTKESLPFDKTFLLEILLLAGMAFMTTRLLLQALSLRKARKRATLVNSNEGIRLYSTWDSTVPFSFGQSIYAHTDTYAAEDLRRIVEHETVHIQERHWLDILFFQVLLILQWWNPLAWFLDRASRQNLEFLADKAVLKQGADRKQYQYLLLKVSGLAAPPLCNGFNFSPLKNRIIMMNKRRSSRFQGWRFLLALPALVVLLSALRRHPTLQGTGFYYTGYAVDARTLLPIEGVTITENTMGLTTTTDANGFFRIESPFDPGSLSQQGKVTAHKEGRLDAFGGVATPSKLNAVHGTILMELPLRTDTAGGNLPYSMTLTFSDSTYKLTLDDLVAMQRDDRKREALFHYSPDKIYYVAGNDAYLLIASGSVSMQDTTAPVLVDRSLVLSGDEVNRRYKRNQIKSVGSLQADSAFKVVGIRRAMLEIQTKP